MNRGRGRLSDRAGSRGETVPLIGPDHPTCPGDRAVIEVIGRPLIGLASRG
jgi:hypothetical protein